MDDRICHTDSAEMMALISAHHYYTLFYAIDSVNITYIYR